jgi:hypothetical protein
MDHVPDMNDMEGPCGIDDWIAAGGIWRRVFAYAVMLAAFFGPIIAIAHALPG